MPLDLPTVIFGSSALGNLYEAPSDEKKLDITRAWLACGESPTVIDSAGKYGAGLALEMIGKNLRTLQAPADEVLISNKLGWLRTPLTSIEPTFEPGAWVDIQHDAKQRISRQGILDCWEQGLELLGEPYQPQLVSVHDPDEFLAAASDEQDRQHRIDDLLGAYDSLLELRQQGVVRAVGVGSKDWRIAKLIADRVSLDWVMLANRLTIYTHPQELLDWISLLGEQQVTVINSAVFNAGFLVGGRYFDYRVPSPEALDDQPLFAWRDAFLNLCQRHEVLPAAACVQFALSPPQVSSVSLNTSRPERVAECVELGQTQVTGEFWSEAKQAGLIARAYPYLTS
ncbi:aldo/keto reductase [Aeoliella sp. ICT_H6.2]|uniref:Aldo/keto reductase n=1 Tax=Aeoliella straminimaris TaxID=2954799 RepID=A0A9X2JKC8_9BACT|nr:aldo/keto reductase [Aeoliella straminimaris]MCO6046259.1 aldo/keto reductase [Aeoliella straminimaris]